MGLFKALKGLVRPIKAFLFRHRTWLKGCFQRYWDKHDTQISSKRFQSKVTTARASNSLWDLLRRLLLHQKCFKLDCAISRPWYRRIRGRAYFRFCARCQKVFFSRSCVFSGTWIQKLIIDRVFRERTGNAFWPCSVFQYSTGTPRGRGGGHFSSS